MDVQFTATVEGSWSSEEVRVLIWFLWTKRVSYIEVYCHLVELCEDGVRNVKYRTLAQRVRKLLDLLRDDKRTASRPSTSRTDVNAARVEETDLRQKRQFGVR